MRLAVDRIRAAEARARAEHLRERHLDTATSRRCQAGAAGAREHSPRRRRRHTAESRSQPASLRRSAAGSTPTAPGAAWRCSGSSPTRSERRCTAGIATPGVSPEVASRQQEPSRRRRCLSRQREPALLCPPARHPEAPAIAGAGERALRVQRDHRERVGAAFDNAHEPQALKHYADVVEPTPCPIWRHGRASWLGVRARHVWGAPTTTTPAAPTPRWQAWNGLLRGDLHSARGQRKRHRRRLSGYRCQRAARSQPALPSGSQPRQCLGAP